MAWFRKEKTVSIKETKISLPDGLWVKCDHCKEIIYRREIERSLHVCPKCNYHFRISAGARLELIIDHDSFEEWDSHLRPLDPLGFVDSKPYPERIKTAKKATGMEDALLSGQATIGGYPISICVFEFNFLGGSMASVVGEKITRAIERSAERSWPIIIISCTGGARMQEGVLSLMQMAKTSAALARLARAGPPFISILADPTTGGVTASFAMLGDIIISEPKALIGFAGPRVIEQTIRQGLPPGFQRAEFLLGHGFVDMIVDRKRMREVLIKLLEFFAPEKERAVSL